VIVEAWTFALLSYRDLTCRPDPFPAELVTDTDSEQAKSSPPDPTAKPRRPATDPPRHRSLPSKPPVEGLGELDLSPSLRPTDSTREALASYVAGYRRQLPAGHTHSVRAARTARSLGIALGQNQTWVPAHWRRRDRHHELAFDWTFPFGVDAQGRLT
jgi:hypothetical protein